jgi:putative membrane protein (TIGR04086 family)
MKVARSVAGVMISYVVFAASAFLFFQLVGRDPHASQDAFFIAEATVFGMAMAVLGGFLAAWVAGRKPVLHALIVGALIFIGAVASLFTSPRTDATWSQISAIVFMAPSAILGGVAKLKFLDKK